MSIYRRLTVPLIALTLTLLAGALPIPAARAQSAPTYVPQTGHYLGGAFREFWLRRGGVEIFGYPITEEYIRRSDGRVVQYFERARFELVGNSVQLGLVGREYMQARGLGFPPIAPVANTADRRYFPETGHSIQGEFKRFWEGRGGVEIFGFPLSEELTEQVDGANLTVQYFERARFELRGGRTGLGLIAVPLAPCQRRPALPPNNPPRGPVAEGNPKECDSIPNAVATGRVYPSPAAPGQILGFEARNYLPNEPVSLWINLPGGATRGLPYQAIAAADGGVLIGFRTESSDPPGTYSLVGQGNVSGRIVVAVFEIRR